MKGLNKLALATAVAAAPFAAQAELTAMSDQAMGNTTGQAGVTIELKTNVNIGEVAYSQETNGSFLLSDIRVGGFADGETLDLAANIDLQDNGDAVINLKNIANDGSQAVEMGLDVASAGLEGGNGENATLISGLEMDAFLSQLDITASTADLIADPTGAGDRSTDAGSLRVDAAFAIDQLDVNFDVAAVSLEGMRMGGAGSLAALQNDGSIGQNIQDPTAPDPTSSIAAAPAVVQMDIGSGGSLSGNGPDNTLRVNVNQFAADIWMPTINVGSGDSNGVASIGSVGISNLEVTDTQMAIYGRE